MKIKKSVKKVALIILIIVAVVLVGFLGYKIYDGFLSGKSPTQPEVVNTIDGYGYTLENDAPKGYEAMFDELKDLLYQSEINEEEYAKLVARMLVYDFYNLDNKISKNDVGGTEFILEDYRSNFILEASETVYKYIEHDIYQNRTQKLPVVTSTEVTNVRTGQYRYDDYTDDKAYIVTVKVGYEEDLGYPTEVTVKMLHVLKEVDEKDSEGNTVTKEYNTLQVFYMK